MLVEFKLKYFLALSIHVNVVSGLTIKKAKDWTDKNFSGRFHLVETLNGRPAYQVSFLIDKKHFKKIFVNFLFQRDEKTECGRDIRLWYQETEKKWLLTCTSKNQTKSKICYMHIKSQGKHEL